MDGFNLYYGCLKSTPFKWLNIRRLSKLLFPKHTIAQIKYFTAPVKIRNSDSDRDKPNRQQIYLRALQTLPDVEIIYGSFLTHVVTMKEADQNKYVRVIKTEEKGTDVNIATHLINDGHKGLYEMAVIISNDSDLVEPVRIVTQELGLPVAVISPYKTNTIELKKIATFVKQLRSGILRVSQFPDMLMDEVGIFRRPEGWE
jgi:uncharacterized LabA/DUF88 family protein